MSYAKVKLQKCPKPVEVDVFFTETEIEVPVGENETLPSTTVEIDEVNYEGDILTIFAWYKYNDLIDELVEHIKGK